MEFIYALMPALMDGLKETLKVFFITLILSIPLGLIVSLARISKNKVLNGVSNFYVLIMRGTPLLLQLVIVFFGLPLVGISLDRFIAAIIAFVLNYGAYFSEIFRGGIKDIDKGQHEAAEMLGFSKGYVFIKIIMPQMIKKVLPAVTNEIITLVKDTSLVYVVGISELLRVGKVASNREVSLIPLFAVGAIYLIIICLISQSLKLLENRYNYYS